MALEGLCSRLSAVRHSAAFAKGFYCWFFQLESCHAVLVPHQCKRKVERVCCLQKSVLAHDRKDQGGARAPTSVGTLCPAYE